MASDPPTHGSDLPEGVEVDEGKLRRVRLVEPDEQVAGVEVLMEEARVVEVGGQLGDGDGEPLPHPDLAGRLHRRQSSLDELVERHGVGDGGGDEIVLEQEVILALLAEGDGGDGRHADRDELPSASAFVASLAAAEPLAGLGADVGDEEVLDVDRPSRQVGPIDDTMRPGLDREQRARGSPLVEPEAGLAEQGVPPVGTDPPPGVARAGPAPSGRLKHPVGGNGHEACILAGP